MSKKKIKNKMAKTYKIKNLFSGLYRTRVQKKDGLFLDHFYNHPFFISDHLNLVSFGALRTPLGFLWYYIL